MPLKGTLRSWNDDRRFGFIAPASGGRELFVHISAFPKDGFRPMVGESLSFEIGHGKDAKPQAVHVSRLDFKHSSSRMASRRGHTTRRRFPLSAAVTLTIFVAAGVAFVKYNEYQPEPSPTTTETTPDYRITEQQRERLKVSEASTETAKHNGTPARQRERLEVSEATPETSVSDETPEQQYERLNVPVATPEQTAFRCDGRTYCSQMNSCSEATFFLRNCPGVKMDGDHDGVPCEQQWCTSPR